MATLDEDIEFMRKEAGSAWQRRDWLAWWFASSVLLGWRFARAAAEVSVRTLIGQSTFTVVTGSISAGLLAPLYDNPLLRSAFWGAMGALVLVLARVAFRFWWQRS